MEHLPARRPPEQAESGVMEPRGLGRVPSGPVEFVEINSDATGDEFSYWLQYLNVLTRHKIAILLITVCGALVAFGVSLYETPIYVTRTTLEFNQGSGRQPFEGISFLSNGDYYQIQTQVQLLKSRMLQRRVNAKLSGKGNDANTSAPDPLGFIRESLGLSSPKGSLGWEEAIDWASSGLTITPVKETSIVQIVCESTLPEAAADYANTLAQEFIQQNQEERWAMYERTSAWLDRAQEELKTKLEASERQLLTYATESGLIVTSKEQDILGQRVVEMQSEMSRAQAQRIEKEAIYRTAMSRRPEFLGEMLDRGPMASYEMKLADLRRDLAEATTSLTANHPKVKRLQAQIDEVKGAQSRERDNILNRMRTEYEAALHREKQLLQGFDTETRALSQQDQKLIRYKMLQREVETYRKLYDTTLQTGKEASLASALRPGDARIIDRAYTPRQPSKPDLISNLAVGLVAGMILGAALVLVRERTDSSVRVPGSMTSHINLRELGVIPSAKADHEVLAAAGGKLPRSLPAADPGRRIEVSRVAVPAVELATWNRKASLMAESFRATLTSVLMSGQNGHDKQIILVTSPSPREGKSTVVTNLAIALAEIQQRVLLIDADMRRPRLHTIFGQANTWGLSDLLLEKTPCADYPPEALARKTHVPGLFSLPSGAGGVGVSRLLYSTRMSDLLNRLRTEFDAVLIDTPPVLSVADARILARLVDAVVLVFRAGQTKREAAMMAVNVFEADGVPVCGTVLNDWNPRTMGDGSYPPDYLGYYRDASSG